MKISHIDHIVLTVKNIDVTVKFYESVLGMSANSFITDNNETRISLKFGHQKLNLHQLGNEFEPKATKPVAGSEDLCFITKTPLDDAIEDVMRQGVEIIEGPVKRTGSTGSILSFYFKDPDGNLIEVANSLG